MLMPSSPKYTVMHGSTLIS